MTVHWGRKRYYSLDYYLKKTYGEKLYKISLDGGYGMSNRDGTFSGPTVAFFCSRGGFRDFAASRTLSVTEQIGSREAAVCKKIYRIILHCLFSGIHQHLCFFRISGNGYIWKQLHPRYPDSFHSYQTGLSKRKDSGSPGKFKPDQTSLG